METEVKISIADGLAFERSLEQAGFTRVTPRTFERNTLYDTPDRKLRAARQILRIREYGGHWTVTHKATPSEDHPRQPYKRRVETETEVADGTAVAAIFEQLGFQPVFTYEKWRTEWADQIGNQAEKQTGCHCLLDETPLGLYVELEGPGEWIETAARRLGVDSGRFITLSYGRIFEMWRERTQAEARNLTFAEIGPRPR